MNYFRSGKRVTTLLFLFLLCFTNHGFCEWTPLKIQISENQVFPQSQTVIGLNLNLFGYTRSVYGLQLGGANRVENLYGIQVGLLPFNLLLLSNLSDNVYGIQISPF